MTRRPVCLPAHSRLDKVDVALSFNPQDLPVLGTDLHLPAITAPSLTPASLRARFAAPPVWTPEIKTEGRHGDREPAHASVLIPLVLRDSLTVLLTQRTDHLTNHPGQISFPGGRAEAHDADAAATALREAHEEIGLEPDHVEPLGYLDGYRTGTGYGITPLVAFVQPQFKLQLAPGEVAAAFEVPLRFLMTANNHLQQEREWRGRRRAFWAMPFGERYIWGATAGMLRNLFDRLYAS